MSPDSEKFCAESKALDLAIVSSVPTSVIALLIIVGNEMSRSTSTSMLIVVPPVTPSEPSSFNVRSALTTSIVNVLSAVNAVELVDCNSVW